MRIRKIWLGLLAVIGLSFVCATAQSQVPSQSDGVWVRLWHDPAVLQGQIVFRFEYLKLQDGHVENGYGGVTYPSQTSCVEWPEKGCVGARDSVQFTGDFELDDNALIVSNYQAVNSLIDRAGEDRMYFRPNAFMAECCEYEFNIDGETATMMRNNELRAYLRFSEGDFSALRTLIEMLNISAARYGTCMLSGAHKALSSMNSNERETKILALLKLAKFADQVLAKEAVFTKNGTLLIADLLAPKDASSELVRAALSRTTMMRAFIGSLVSSLGSVQAGMDAIGNKMLKGKGDQAKTAMFISELFDVEGEIKRFNSFTKILALDEKTEITKLFCPAMELPVFP